MADGGAGVPQDLVSSKGFRKGMGGVKLPEATKWHVEYSGPGCLQCCSHWAQKQDTVQTASQACGSPGYMSHPSPMEAETGVIHYTHHPKSWI